MTKRIPSVSVHDFAQCVVCRPYLVPAEIYPGQAFGICRRHVSDLDDVDTIVEGIARVAQEKRHESWSLTHGVDPE